MATRFSKVVPDLMDQAGESDRAFLEDAMARL
jgi:hypothetical protein